MQRWALGVTYSGSAYEGWQSQPGGNTVQDRLERALCAFAATGEPIATMCAGRTDAGVHALMQVVHFDTRLRRAEVSWVRGVNAHLPANIAVQWAVGVAPDFHARACARTRRYIYIVLESAVRPSIEAERVGWVFRPLSLEAMQAAAAHLIGEHDFSSFRAAQCQAASPIKTLLRIDISPRGEPMQRYWRFEFEGNAFLHHMVRNIMGCLITVGQGRQAPEWMRDVVQARRREAAAPTFAAAGLYFAGPTYEARWGLPHDGVTAGWLP